MICGEAETFNAICYVKPNSLQPYQLWISEVDKQETFG